MFPSVRAMLISLVSHALVLGGGVLAARMLRATPAPVTVDLSELMGGGGGEQEQPKAPKAAPMLQPPVPVAVPRDLPAPVLPTTAPLPPVLSENADAAPLAAPPDPGQQPEPSFTGGGAAGKGTPGQGNSSGSGLGSGVGPGKGDGLDVLRAIYLREHFAYIRDRIANHLIYPAQAIRAGWSGRVIVTFIVLEDGRVDALGVAKGSGCCLLDRDALATVQRSAPFPKPPVSARLVIPVEYNLE
nr:energy transducer TonB [uncultured Holophaga sp.]